MVGASRSCINERAANLSSRILVGLLIVVVVAAASVDAVEADAVAVFVEAANKQIDR